MLCIEVTGDADLLFMSTHSKDVFYHSFLLTFFHPILFANNLFPHYSHLENLYCYLIAKTENIYLRYSDRNRNEYNRLTTGGEMRKTGRNGNETGEVR